MSLKLRKLSYGLGAEICDIDVAAPMSESAFGEIPRAFLDHGILLFRDQNITREQHLAFSRRFGELDRHDAFPSDRHPTIPELMLVTNEPQPDGTPSVSRYTGRRWHTDMSHTLEPSLGSLLRCWKIPPVGGDTLFANMTMAYDALSHGMQKLIATQHGRNSSTATSGASTIFCYGTIAVPCTWRWATSIRNSAATWSAPR
jgi:taurine dioxygenase